MKSNVPESFKRVVRHDTTFNLLASAFLLSLAATIIIAVGVSGGAAVSSVSQTFDQVATWAKEIGDGGVDAINARQAGMAQADIEAYQLKVMNEAAQGSKGLDPMFYVGVAVVVVVLLFFAIRQRQDRSST